MHHDNKEEAEKYIYKIGDFFSEGYEKTFFKMDESSPFYLITRLVKSNQKDDLYEFL